MTLGRKLCPQLSRHLEVGRYSSRRLNSVGQLLLCWLSFLNQKDKDGDGVLCSQLYASGTLAGHQPGS